MYTLIKLYKRGRHSILDDDITFKVHNLPFANQKQSRQNTDNDKFVTDDNLSVVARKINYIY